MKFSPKNVELRNCKLYTQFSEVFAHFLIGKGPIFGPKSGLENPWIVIIRVF